MTVTEDDFEPKIYNLKSNCILIRMQGINKMYFKILVVNVMYIQFVIV